MQSVLSLRPGQAGLAAVLAILLWLLSAAGPAAASSWLLARPCAHLAGGVIMAAYALVNVEITDSAGFAEYRKLVPASIARFGGRFLTRGGATEVLEGGWIPNRLVILEFPDMATIKVWYQSAEYQQLLEIRKRTATSDFVIIDGA
jgi:uncharacterized protein (DUF1330 family)